MRHFILIFLLLIPTATAAQSEPMPTTILFWHHYADDTRAEFWQSLADEFNQTNPDGIQVQVQYFPSYQKQHDAILSGLLNGTKPDVAMVRNYDAAFYQLGNALVDLSFVDADVFYPEMWAQDNLNGQQLGIPLSRAAAALYVNMDALRDLGYENPPTTRDELAEMSCAYHQDVLTNAAWDIPLDASYLLALAYPADFTDPTLPEYLKDLLARGCVRLSVNEAFAPQNRFASGQTIFYFDSTSAEPYVTAAIGSFYAEPFDLAILPIPAANAPVANLTGASLSIFRSDPAREAAAIEWVSWLAEPKQLERWVVVNHAIPARRDVSNPDMAIFADAQWMTEEHGAGYEFVRDEYVFAMRDILNGVDIAPRLADFLATKNQIQQAFELE